MAREARQQMISGRYRPARAQAMQAIRAASPAIEEISAKPGLPAPVQAQFSEQAAVSRDAVARAIEAVRSTGNVAGMPHFEQAASLLGAAAQPAGGGRPPARTMAQAAAELDRAIGARWPQL
jgi:hypothetical protein